MTLDEVIDLFNEAGDLAEWKPGIGNLMRFAELVAKREREACAVKMDAIAHQCRMEDSDCEPFVYAAAAIRARGKECKETQ